MDELKEVLLMVDRLKGIARRVELTDGEHAALAQAIILLRRWQAQKLRDAGFLYELMTGG